MIIRGGENIPVAYVENVLYEHPDVAAVALVGLPDPRLQERACAVVVLTREALGSQFTMEAMRAFLAEKGVARQYWPERLELMAELPRTASGKIRKFEIRDRRCGEDRRRILVAGVRTPFGRYGGALAAVRPDDLAAHAVGALTRRLPSVDWAAVDDVVLGCANQAGEDNRNVARMAALLAGLPVEVPGTTVNRLCGSGLDAVAIAARAVRAGEADLVIAGGVESMTRAPHVMPKAGAAWSRTAEVFDTTIGWRFVNPAMRERYGTHAMPETAEIVAERHGISRADQDLFALRSQERAAKAIAERPAGEGDRAGSGAAAEGRARGRRGRRAPPGHLDRRPGEAPPALPRRHRDRRELVGHQRRRGRRAGGVRATPCAGTAWSRSLG